MAIDSATQTVEELYRRHGGLVFRTCRAILHDHHEAEDAAQEVFAKLLAQRGAAEAARDQRRWLLEVTRNHCIDRMRAAARRLPSTADAERRAVTGEDAAERSAARDHARWLLSLLPPRQREVLVRRTVLDEPLDTVAEGLGISYGAAAQLLHRARHVLATAGRAGGAGLVLAGGRFSALGRRLRARALRVRPLQLPLDPTLAIPVAAVLVLVLGGPAGSAHAAAASAVAPPPASVLPAAQPVAVRVAAAVTAPAPATVERSSAHAKPAPPSSHLRIAAAPPPLPVPVPRQCFEVQGIPECFVYFEQPASVRVQSNALPVPLP